MSKLLLSKVALLASLLSNIVLYSLYAVFFCKGWTSLALLFFVLPLLFPLRGTLHYKRYTIGYSAMLATWYFLLSAFLLLGKVFLSAEFMLLCAASIASIIWFFGALMHNHLTDPNPRFKSKKSD